MSFLSGITGGQSASSFLQSQLFGTSSASSSSTSGSSSSSPSGASTSSSSSSGSTSDLGGWLAAQLSNLQTDLQNGISQGATSSGSSFNAIGSVPPNSPVAQLLYGTASGTTPSITQTQFNQAYASQAAQDFASLDQNGSGTIDAAEAQTALQNRMSGPATLLYAQMNGQWS